MEDKFILEVASPEDLSVLPFREIEASVFSGQPFVLRVAQTEVYIQIVRHGRGLKIEVSQVEGDSESIMAPLCSLIRRYGTQADFDQLDWLVRPVSQGKPSLQLADFLESRGFKVESVGGKLLYRRVDNLLRQ